MSELNKMFLGIIVAFCDKDQGISNNGDMPWPYIKTDHDFYMDLLTSTVDPGKKNGILLGRLSWETMSAADKPKILTVVTSTSMKEVPTHCMAVAPSYEKGITQLMNGVNRGQVEKIWILGGSKNYRWAIEDPRVSRLYITRVFQDFPVDNYFPAFQHHFHLVSTSEIHKDNDVPLQFETWERNQV